MGKCIHCGSEFSGRGLGGHIIRCNSNPNRIFKNGHEGTTISDTRRSKLKQSMQDHFARNPHMIPFKLYHSSKRSNPELIFEKKLIEHGIKFIPEYSHGLYSYDFALVEEKIDIEIDGPTHLQLDVSRKDQVRDAWSKSQGWRVFRIPAKRIRNDLEQVFKEFLEFRNSPM